MIYVDFPVSDGSFACIETFRTKRAAVAWLRENWGEYSVDSEGKMNLLSGEDEEVDSADEQP